jgi:hypothetical protein
MVMRRWILLVVMGVGLIFGARLGAGEPAAKVYVVLWFDTEDYLLPASDDAALRIAEFLHREGVRATFKVVGEKARTLERRGRKDVIAALKQHEIGYHSNYHSVQPSPAMYLSCLDWDEGVAEFDRREKAGRADIERIFGTAPSCYGQPGSSWGPQVYGAMNQWGMKVYLDAGRHVDLEGRPCYYCGVLNLYKLTHTLRANLDGPQHLPEAEERFLTARKQLTAEGGGVVSIFYHPCEFVHKEFWDGVNFRNGANPPREEWKVPPAKTPEESRIAYEVLEEYIRFIKRYSDVQFVTASEALQLYRDQARGRAFSPEEIKAMAQQITPDVSFQRKKDYALAAGELFSLLVEFLDAPEPKAVVLRTSPKGPSRPVVSTKGPVSTDASQFSRTIHDVADYLQRHDRIPTAVWLGSVAVPPEAFLVAMAQVAEGRAEGKPLPATIPVQPARLGAARYVAADDPGLWGWIIFPSGFRAPEMMQLAKRQSWTLKPALLNRSAN